MLAIKNAVPILILIFIAFSSGGGCAQSDDARGGYILIIDIDASSSTNYWLGYYGSVIPASESQRYLDNRTRIQEINISWVGGYLLITDSQDVPNPAYLIAGSPATIDDIIGTGYDSGSRTFTATADYTIYDRLLPAPTAYTFVNCSRSTRFKEGFFTEKDKGNLVFIVPIVETATCYNAMSCNFQFILPNNPANPRTYYMYHIPVVPEPVEPTSHHGGTYPPGWLETPTANATVTVTAQPEATNISTPGETPFVHETEGEAAYEPGEEDGLKIPYLTLLLLLIIAALIFVIYIILRSYKKRKRSMR